MKTLLPIALLLACLALPLHAANGVAPAPGTDATEWDKDQALTKEQLRKKVEQLQEDLRNGGEVGFDQTSLNTRMDAMAQRIEENRLALAEKNARINAITQRIDELTKKGSDAVDRDPVARELQKIIEQKQAEAERETKSGAVSASEVGQSAAAVAEARVNLEQRREAVMAAVGGGILAELNRDLTLVSIDADVLNAMRLTLTDEMHRLLQVQHNYMELNNVSNLLTTRP